MKLVTVFTLLILLQLLRTDGLKENTKHYIVYMGDHSHPNTESVIAANHDILLSTVTGIDSFDGAQKAVVYHYSKAFRGFSAMLTPQQAQELAEHESVVSVFESKTNHVHTTHSWDFLGLTSATGYSQLPKKSNSDVIVGVLDTGVWPESKSFSDIGLGPVPKRFKGECVSGDHFSLSNCNRKLIGARVYYKGFESENGPLEAFNKTFFRSPRDTDGHGTHTASTIGGSVVNNVSLLGIAAGTARGGMPGARLAIYKVCWFEDCSDADILMGFDDATNDGVDILSVSLGPGPPQPSFFHDALSIGSFHAFRKGVLTSASAGNSGLPSTACNVAPWILTVAASSVDREFVSILHLGNSKMLQGKSVNPLKMEGYYGIIDASVAAAPGVPAKNASFCKENNALDPTLIKGKIVVCALEIITDIRTQKSIIVREAGGVGMILIDPLAKDVSFQYVIPTTVLGQEEALELQAYLTAYKNPTAIIHPTTTVFNARPAPRMAVFSSMGPNVITPDILKPDITAPGMNILAAWSPLATDGAAERSLDYNIISGTSMSCPHVTAIAAIVKSVHPSWSSSAIKSAIMTTATVSDTNHALIARDPFGSQTTPFDYGSGHVNPIAALNPGLVYDFNSDDIIDFLCSKGAGTGELKNLTGETLACKKYPTPSYNLNYPSIGISKMNGNMSVTRTVTYYGNGPTAYMAFVESPFGVKVAVKPYKLKFQKYGEKKSYRVDFLPYKNSNGSFVFGSLTWRNAIHVVRSPIGLNVISV